MSVTIAQINEFSQADFVHVFGPVFEHSPWIAESAWWQNPFADGTALLQSLCETVKAAGEDRQISLIRAHPDLVGRAALAGTLTPASAGEQASAGLDRLAPEEIAQFQRQNTAYQAKFGFPFVICARLNKKEAILAGFARRLQNSREMEIETALAEIFKIAELRLHDLLSA